MSSLRITGIGRLVTNDGPPVEDAVVAIDEGRISYAGPTGGAPEIGNVPTIACEGRAVIPGFVDAHTHLVFAGERSEEFAARLAGASYAEIAKSGGGILATVAATREASEAELFETAAARARTMLGSGTTTIEVKSGYGLELETELRILRVARRLGTELPLTVKTTFLGAHTVPREHQDRRERYIPSVVEEMLPAVVDLADYCDVFVEEGAFNVDEARRIFQSAADLGLGARVHAEQLRPGGGGAALAAEIGAVSADHLDHVTETDVMALAGAGVGAVLTPGASYSLGTRQAPGRMLLEKGVNVALATDCNPGTSYLESMGLVVSLACVQMGLTVSEAVYASTRGGALSLGLPDHGHLVSGAIGDLVVLDAPSEAHLAYRPATNLAWATVKAGTLVARNGRVIAD